MLENAAASPPDPASSMQMAIHGFRFRRLLGRIHTSLYSNKALEDAAAHLQSVHAWNLRAELENWRASVPPLLPLKGQALSFFTTRDGFITDYYYAVLLLCRVQIIDCKGEATSGAFIECVQAAVNILRAYRGQFIGKPTCYTWGALHELFLAGLTYLNCLWTSADARRATRPDQVSSNCTDCTVVLAIMAERWDVAAPYRDIFEALAGHTMTMMTDKEHERPTSLGSLTESGDPDVESMMRWRSRIPDMEISSGIDILLTSLIGDMPSDTQAAANEGSW